METPHSRPRDGATIDPSTENYRHTMLCNLESRWLRSRFANAVLILILATAVLVPSIQSIHKIQEIDHSEYRDDNQRRRTALGRWLPTAELLSESPLADDPYGFGHWFPLPPLILLTLTPLTTIPPAIAAAIWAGLKIAGLLGMFWLLLTAIRQHQFAAPLGVIAMAIIFSLRPIIGDLQHANVNIFVAVWCGLTLAFYLKRRDIAAGVCLSLAIVTKITPALLLVYFAYKRSWRLCATATGGLVLLFLVLPGMLLGFGENLRLLGNWFDMLIAPFAFKGFAAVESANQSVYGVAVRLAEMIGFPPVERMPLQDAMSAGMEEMARPAGVWRFILRGAISLPILATAAWLCRSRDASRRDPRVLLEFALILIAMLLLSERTWKHHATTLPIVYLTLWYVVTCLNWSDRQRAWLAGGLFAQLALLNFTTSGIFGDRGAEALLRVGAFTWGLLICFVQTGWMLRRYTIHLNMRPHESRAACSIAET